MTATPPLRRARRIAAVASLLPAGALLAAFSAPREAAAPSRTVTITAKDFGFAAPDTVTAGVTTIRLLNRGKELHHVQLVRLENGRTMKDFFAAVQAGGPPPAWAHDVGGPNAALPGGQSTTAADLAPGQYMILCFIPSADGTPHVMKGMSRALTVVAPSGAGVAQAGGARAASTITLSDYTFAISAPLAKGTSVVHVVNAAKQSHEVLFVKLAPGKTTRDMAAWVEKQAGPPPGAPMGGTTGIAPGGWNDVTLALSPGEYGLLCFLPDAKDGKPHVAHGMMAQFAVK